MQCGSISGTEMTHFILYSLEGSGNAYKVRLLLRFLGLPFDIVEPAVHPASEDFLKINPLGQVPVLVDKMNNNLVVRDSNAILVYLALKYGGGTEWYPINNPEAAASIAQWMSYATHEISASILWVRVKNRFSWDIPVSYEDALERSREVLRYINTCLEASQSSGQQWLATMSQPSIADLALFPYVALAESSSSGVLSLQEYPAITRWLENIKALPNFYPMPPF